MNADKFCFQSALIRVHRRLSLFHQSPRGLGPGRSYNRVVAKAKDLEVRLQRTEQQLRLFQKISRFMVKDLSLQDVLQGGVLLVVEFTQCDSCLIYLQDGDDLVLCASNTPHPSTIGKLRLRWNEGLTGW